jgi:predicted membrane channel-forming protein YqfA (hemolysin III family)
MIRLLISGLIAFLVILFTTVGLQYINDSQSAFDAEPGDIIRAFIYFVFMIFGLLASERYKYFNNHPEAEKKFFANISYSYFTNLCLSVPSYLVLLLLT